MSKEMLRRVYRKALPPTKIIVKATLLFIKVKVSRILSLVVCLASSGEERGRGINIPYLRSHDLQVLETPKFH